MLYVLYSLKQLMYKIISYLYFLLLLWQVSGVSLGAGILDLIDKWAQDMSSSDEEEEDAEVVIDEQGPVYNKENKGMYETSSKCKITQTRGDNISPYIYSL